MKSPFFRLAVFALLCVSGQMSAAEKLPFYVGTYGDGIYRCLLDTETGVVSQVELAAKAKGASFLALSPDRKNLYATLEDSAAAGAWAIGADGGLTALNTQPSGGKAPCHVSVDAAGKHVFVANYTSGSVACFPVNAVGALGPATSVVQHTGSGPDPSRQKGPHAHSIYPSPDGLRVYACDLGTDEVDIYQFDAGAGKLAPNDPPSGHAPPGSGPRHLAFSPDGGLAFVCNEMGLTVTAFQIDPQSGALRALQTISSLPAEAKKEGASTAAIVCHPSGKWLFVSNRGHDTVSVFSIAGDGALKLTQNVAAPAFPRGFGLSPDGKWLVVCGQKDDQVEAFRVETETGRLTPTGQSVTIGKPVCVEFQP